MKWLTQFEDCVVPLCVTVKCNTELVYMHVYNVALDVTL